MILAGESTKRESMLNGIGLDLKMLLPLINSVHATKQPKVKETMSRGGYLFWRCDAVM